MKEINKKAFEAGMLYAKNEITKEEAQVLLNEAIKEIVKERRAENARS